MWIRRARERKAVRRRLAAVADRIGARDGRLVRERFSGNLLTPYGLSIITIRPGSTDAVARAQIDAAVAAGYTDPPRPPCGNGYLCVFQPQNDLPMVSIETFPGGSTIRGIGISIPSGHTGVVITLA